MGQADQRADMRLENAESALCSRVRHGSKLESVRADDGGRAPVCPPPAEYFGRTLGSDAIDQIATPDSPWILEATFRYVRDPVLARIAWCPNSKDLPNGKNGDCRVRSTEDWGRLVDVDAMRPTKSSHRSDHSTMTEKVTGPAGKQRGLYENRTLEHRTVEL